jgi:hypothetical protein
MPVRRGSLLSLHPGGGRPLSQEHGLFSLKTGPLNTFFRLKKCFYTYFADLAALWEDDLSPFLITIANYFFSMEIFFKILIKLALISVIFLSSIFR